VLDLEKSIELHKYPMVILLVINVLECNLFVNTEEH
jgi:hypothetical protein